MKLQIENKIYDSLITVKTWKLNSSHFQWKINPMILNKDVNSTATK